MHLSASAYDWLVEAPEIESPLRVELQRHQGDSCWMVVKTVEMCGSGLSAVAVDFTESVEVRPRVVEGGGRIRMWIRRRDST